MTTVVFARNSQALVEVPTMATAQIGPQPLYMLAGGKVSDASRGPPGTPAGERGEARRERGSHVTNASYRDATR